MVKKIFFYITKFYSQKEKEEKVVKVAKPATVKRPLNQNLREQDCNSQLEEYIEF
jgi:hypothetical protein